MVVESRAEPAGPSSSPPQWRLVAEDSIYRYERPQTVEKLRVEASGRERMLRLRIRNRDDRPLSVSAVKLVVPVEQVVFEALPGQSYRLSYGDPARHAPAYDIERTIHDPAAWIAQAREGRLGPAARLSAAAHDRPWLERHPRVLWGGLVSAVLLLGAITWRALRDARA